MSVVGKRQISTAVNVSVCIDVYVCLRGRKKEEEMGSGQGFTSTGLDVSITTGLACVGVSGR